MNRSSHFCPLIICLLGLPLVSSADPSDQKATVTGTAVAAPAPEANPLSFANGAVVFDAQERLRWENRSNNFDFNSAVRSPTDGNWLEQRFRLGVTIKPAAWLSLYAQGQDALEINGDRGTIPGASSAEGDDYFNLRQAYVQIADYDVCPFGLKLGRQVFNYGDLRLVGEQDWLNYSRTFDAAKLTFQGHGFWVDAFVSTPAVIYQGRYDQSDLFNGTETHRGLVFSGLYLSLTSLPFGVWDAYSFLVDQPRGNTATAEGFLPAAPPSGSLNAHSDFVTLGTRIKGDPLKLKGWEYEGEFAYQAGDVRGLSLSAFAAHAGAGYNFNVAWVPRLYVEYDYASGDDNSTDGHINTFQNLFPSNHGLYGLMDEFAWQNMHEALISLRVSPLKSLTAKLDYSAHWLATTSDAWYRPNGFTTVRPLSSAAGQNVSNYAGSELDLVLTWNATSHLNFQAGYSHFFAGTYLKDTGAHSDADFGYLQVTINY